MQLVRIAGPAEPMRRLAEVEGLEFERTSATRLGGRHLARVGLRHRRGARRSCAGAGLSVELVVEAAQLDEQRATLFASITRADAGGGDGPAGA